MKKTLVALAALAVVSAASAQSAVTLYGVVDMGVAQQKDSNDSNAAFGGVAANSTSVKNGVNKGILSRSRIGFKGTEDLGGGLKANFVMELGLNPDETNVALENRQSFVGLSGNFGAMTVGRQYTPYHTVQYAMDLYGNLNDTPGYVVNAHNRARASNSVQYASPSFGGFTAIAQVAAGGANAASPQSVTAETVVTPTNSQAEGKSYGLAGIYAAGPLVAGIAYDEVTKPGAGTYLSGYSPVSGAPVSGYAFGNGSDNVKTWAAGASYDFTVVKASLAYSSLTDVKATRADMTSKGWNASIAAPLGAVTLLGNLGRANIQLDGAVDATITGFQVGANYALSKRTTAYALVGRDKLQDSFATGDITRQTTAVGIRHTF